MRVRTLAATLVLGLPTVVFAQELVGIRIDGLPRVDEKSVSFYTVVAEFEGGLEFDVTLSSFLSVAPGEHAQIGVFGALTTFHVPLDQVETINAVFVFGSDIATASLDVTVVNVPRNVHVSPDGSDEGNGSVDNPYRSIQYAIDMADDSDRVVLLPGVFAEKEIEVDKRLRLEAAPPLGATVAGGGSGVIFWVFADCEFFGLTIRDADNGIVERHTNTSGYKWRVDNCIIEDMSEAGLIINQFLSPWDFGYAEWRNVVARNCALAFGTNDADGFLAENCVALDCDKAFSVTDRRDRGGTARYSGVWNCPVQFEPASIEDVGIRRDDPHFVGGTPFNYRLRPDSPYIDAGNPDAEDPDGSRIDVGVYGGLGNGVAGQANFDGDDDVDLEDYRHIRACLNGPAAGILFGCDLADLDKDDDVDLSDIGSLQVLFGP
jgi:hypothetical protein